METETMVWVLLVLILAIFASIKLRSSIRHRARRESLYRDGTGTWVWMEFDGSTRRSEIHPERPGGAWHSESSSGWGDGDGGGDGGGD